MHGGACSFYVLREEWSGGKHLLTDTQLEEAAEIW